MIEDNFSQLQTLRSVLIVEVELDSLRVSVDLGEVNCMQSPHAELKLSMGNLVPATLQYVENMNANFRGRPAWMITSALKANALELNFRCEFDFNPGPLMIISMPFVPILNTGTQQILGVVSNSVVFSCHTSSFVKVNALKSHSHSGGLDDGLLVLLLRTLFKHNSWLHHRLD